MSPGEGIVDLPSPYAMAETIERIEAALQSANLKLFCFVDHSGEAEKAGMRMQPAKLLIFGNPKGGTPLMIAAPTLALDLPLKALVWQDSHGQVRVSYNSPEYLHQRHNIPAELVKNIAGVGPLLEKALA